jgi:hypothetical protein
MLNILFISSVYTTIIVVITAIYYFPLDQNYIFLYYFIGAGLITSILNHGAKPGNYKNIVQKIDRIIIRAFGIYLLFNAHNFECSEKMKETIIFNLFLGSLLYIFTRCLVLKKKHYPIIFSRIPHFIAHLIACYCIVYFFVDNCNYKQGLQL